MQVEMQCARYYLVAATHILSILLWKTRSPESSNNSVLQSEQNWPFASSFFPVTEASASPAIPDPGTCRWPIPESGDSR